MTETAKRERKKDRPDGGATVMVRLVKSGICTPKDQKATLRGLGFRRLGQSLARQDTPALRGMLRKVRHLVQVEPTKG